MQVNFISEVTGFYRLTKHQHLGMNAQMLWFHLFNLWNEAGYPDWLQVDLQRMMSMIQVNSKSTVTRARNELIAAGLLVGKNGGNRQPNLYRLISLAQQNKPTPKCCGSKNEPPTGPQTRLQTGPETSPLYKRHDTKPKLKKEKAAYGQYGNVLLTLEELNKLQTEFPDSWEDWIKRLDAGKEAKGYTYANDYAAILNWMEKDEQDARDKAFAELMEECALLFG